MASSHIPQIFLRVTIQNQICVAQWVVIDETKKQSVPDGERPVVHIVIVCGFNRKFYKQRNSQRPVCDMQFTVVANESNRELRWQGASGWAHPVFVFPLITVRHRSFQ